MKPHILPRIILASASPRRVRILQEHQFNAVIMPSNIDETVHPGEEAKAYVTRLAKAKAKAALPLVEVDKADLVLAADTTVAFDNHILEKPRSTDDAYRMLRMLSGSTHQVYTGYALVFLPQQHWFLDYEATQISFHKLTEEQITNYIDTGDPFDKAGGYGIQTVGDVFVKEIKGSYFNVMGLPIERISKIITTRLTL
jgi:septum formation protein